MVALSPVALNYHPEVRENRRDDPESLEKAISVVFLDGNDARSA